MSGTRISDIAERAGTSDAAVLYWFDSKEQLLSAALTYEEERFQQELEERLPGDESASRRLADLIDSSTGDPSSGASDWRLWMELWIRALRDPDADSTREELDRRWRAEISTIVAEGQRSGGRSE